MHTLTTMDISALQAFLAVAEEHSFSRAAARLHITQPAVSKRIAALEEELGVRLFDRLGRTVRLTEAGLALVPNSHRILEELKESRRVIANLSGNVRGRLTVGTSHHVGLHRLPAVLRTYTGRYPDVELDLRFLDSESACQAVEQGELELATVTLPLQPPQHLLLTEIWDDPLDFVVGRSHSLANLTGLEVARLASQPAILPAAGTFTRTLITEVFERYRLTPRVGLETNYLETIKMMVSVGLGWSALPRTMINDELIVLPIKGISLKRSLGVVQHRARTLTNAGEAFLATLAESRTPRAAH